LTRSIARSTRRSNETRTAFGTRVAVLRYMTPRHCDIPDLRHSDAGIIRCPLVMQVNPSFPAKTVPEFIGYVKSNPGKISYGSGGIGTSATPRRLCRTRRDAITVAAV
jgi:hypothetical protein